MFRLFCLLSVLLLPFVAVPSFANGENTSFDLMKKGYADSIDVDDITFGESYQFVLTVKDVFKGKYGTVVNILVDAGEVKFLNDIVILNNNGTAVESIVMGVYVPGTQKEMSSAT